MSIPDLIASIHPRETLFLLGILVAGVGFIFSLVALMALARLRSDMAPRMKRRRPRSITDEGL